MFPGWRPQLALVDDPKKYILRMFQMEISEGRGSACVVYPGGDRTPGLPLSDHELVYGVYKQTYHFTAESVLIQADDGVVRVSWSEVVSCSSQHGSGDRVAQLQMKSGETVHVRVGDLAQGWSGRISQLFHKMIERWGNSARLGPEPLTLEAFSNQPQDAHSIAPNLEPHPGLEKILEALREVRDRDDVVDVLLGVAEVGDDGAICDRVIILTEDSSSQFGGLAKRLGSEQPVEASSEVSRWLKNRYDEVQVWELIWD